MYYNSFLLTLYPTKKTYPPLPMANKEGYVYMPNVNQIEEMTDMMEASQSYKNNIQVLDTTKRLLMQTIRMGKGG